MKKFLSNTEYLNELRKSNTFKFKEVFDVIDAESSVSMTEKVVELVPDFDIFISTAAISDFTPINKEDFKI